MHQRVLRSGRGTAQRSARRRAPQTARAARRRRAPNELERPSPGSTKAASWSMHSARSPAWRSSFASRCCSAPCRGANTRGRNAERQHADVAPRFPRLRVTRTPSSMVASCVAETIESLCPPLDGILFVGIVNSRVAPQSENSWSPERSTRWRDRSTLRSLSCQHCNPQLQLPSSVFRREPTCAKHRLVPSEACEWCGVSAFFTK